SNTGDRLIERVAAHAGQRLWQASGSICDARHQKSALHSIEEVHRVSHDFGEELIANVVHHFVADPIHVISIAVRAKTADRHDQWNEQANPNDRVDFRTDVEHFAILHDHSRIGCRTAKNEV